MLKTQICPFMSWASYSPSLNPFPCPKRKASDTDILGLWWELVEIMNIKCWKPGQGSTHCSCDFHYRIRET